MAMTFGRCGSSPTPTRRSHADGGRGGDAARPPRGARVLRRLPQPRAPREVADDDRPSLRRPRRLRHRRRLARRRGDSVRLRVSAHRRPRGHARGVRAMPAPALRPRGRRANFQGKHFRLEDAPNVPKPLQPRVSIWIGGRGEKRTLRAAAKYADGRNAPSLGPDEWIHKSRVLDQWCETEKRDPRTIRRTVNPGFSIGADAKGVARREEIFRNHWGPRALGLAAGHPEGRAGTDRKVPRRRLRPRQ